MACKIEKEKDRRKKLDRSGTVSIFSGAKKTRRELLIKWIK